MADAAVETEINDPKELILLAEKAEFARDYNAAVSKYSRAIELLVNEHGDKHDSLGEIYLSYGKTLLEVSRDESEPLGDAVAREYSSDSDADEDNKANDGKEEGSDDKPNTGGGDAKPEEKEAIKTDGEPPNGETVKENGESSNVPKEEIVKDDDGEPTNGSNEDEPSDLQLAWEVLEIAKLIFEQRGTTGRRELSETLVVLGEVSLESENFESAIADIKAGLEIQKEICKPHDRALAETYYKLGTALSTNNQIEESIESYNVSLEILNNRLEKLKENEQNTKDEIQEIESLIPDIMEKISDMKNFKQEAAIKLVAAMESKPVVATSTTFEAGSSGKKVSNISHLVKRKRKEDDVKEEENPSKKISP